MCLDNVCAPDCGDGILVGNETCDPGLPLTCTTDCMSVAAGYTCDSASDGDGQQCVLVDNAVESMVPSAVGTATMSITAITTTVSVVTSVVSAVPGPNMVFAAGCVQSARVTSLF